MNSVGFPIWTDRNFTAPAQIVSLLPHCDDAVAVELAGGVLHVVAAHAPSPAEIAQWESETQLAVTVSLADAETFAALQAGVAAHWTPGSPHAAEATLRHATEVGATDVAMMVGHPPKVRVAGVYSSVPNHPPLSASDIGEAISWLLGPRPAAATGMASYSDGRWRVSSYLTDKVPAVVARRLPAAAPRLENLGVPAAALGLADMAAGLVLIAGPAGSGRTTTVAALVDRLNVSRAVHIATVGRVAEYRHVPRTGVVSHLAVGDATGATATAIDAAVVVGADVIATSQLETEADLRAAVNAAAAGKLVIAEIAATTARSALTRLTTDPVALADNLKGVIVQQLVPATPAPGRPASVLACEVVLASPAVAELVRSRRLLELPAAIDAAVASGMSSMDRALVMYARSGVVDVETARGRAANPDLFDSHLRAPTAAEPVSPRSRRHRGD